MDGILFLTLLLTRCQAGQSLRGYRKRNYPPQNRVILSGTNMRLRLQKHLLVNYEWRKVGPALVTDTLIYINLSDVV